MNLSDTEKKILLNIARESIEFPVKKGHKFQLDPSILPQALKENAAVFVTLHINDDLKGCIGSLKAFRSLSDDVVANAYSAAYEDFRFIPVKLEDLDKLKIEISILSIPVQIFYDNEADLLSKIKEFQDGLIIKLGKRQATFLPSVWEKLPDKIDFLRHLKEKCGLAPDFWSDELQFFKYTIDKIT